jgi:antitoxin component YwqK of YwqJK toxin-antitoxin module
MLDMACPPAAVPQQIRDDDRVLIWRKVTPVNEELSLIEDWYVSNGRKKRHSTINAEGYIEGHYREWFEDGRLRVNTWYKDGRRRR